MKRISTLVGLMGLGLYLSASPALSAEPLKCGLDGTYTPMSFAKPGGGLQGFNIDMFEEIGKRLGQPVEIEAGGIAGLWPALASGRYDFLCVPATATPERAKQLLLSEGYLAFQLQFGIRNGSDPIKAEEDLKGKTIAVVRGSVYENWANTHKDQYAYDILVFDAFPDAVQSVIGQRAYAILTGNVPLLTAAKQVKALVPDFALKDTRNVSTIPFRDDPAGRELRKKIENVLECMKRDGTMAKISEKWLGVSPGPNDPENTVYAGYGVPGMNGYDETPSTAQCSN